MGFVDDPKIIERILTHMGLIEDVVHSPPTGGLRESVFKVSHYELVEKHPEPYTP